MLYATSADRWPSWRATVAALALLPLLVPAAASAQPVVQALPDPAAADLSDAMQRLARDPQSLMALVDAGRASVKLKEFDAAASFFKRAAAIAPSDGRVLAGQALVAVAKRDPIGALALFDRAQASGEALDGYAADRGLAYDLVGQNSRAQVLYGQSLSRSEDPETVRRLALSYAISGDQDAADATLLPLLQSQDLAAYRTRAFTLAIAGKADEAVSIVQTMLPARIAERLQPYLRYMAKLTRAQQAAAANFGTFPHPTEIGTDRPEIAAFAGAAPGGAGGVPAVELSSADARLIPGGAPLGREVAQAVPGGELPPASGAPSSPQLIAAPTATAPTRLATAAPLPASAAPVPAQPVWSSAELAGAVRRPTSPTAAPGSIPAASRAVAPPPTQQVRPAAVQPQLAASAAGTNPPSVSVPVVQSLPAAAPDAASPAPVAASPVAASPVAPPVAPSPAAALPNRPGLSEAFADFQLATPDPRKPRSADAVDITTIRPPRDVKPEPPVRQLPVNPSRQWVQVATGRDVGNFRFDWRRIVGSASGLLEKQMPYYAAWGGNNRLVTGPFASEAEAQKLVTTLAVKGISSFVFTSTGGERIIPLP